MFSNFNKFQFMQCHFSKEVCDKIFSDLSDHIYIKWEEADFNIITFLSFLDSGNKQKMFIWAENSLKNKQ